MAASRIFASSFRNSGANARVADSDSFGTASHGKFLCAAAVNTHRNKANTTDKARISTPYQDETETNHARCPNWFREYSMIPCRAEKVQFMKKRPHFRGR